MSIQIKIPQRGSAGAFWLLVGVSFWRWVLGPWTECFSNKWDQSDLLCLFILLKPKSLKESTQEGSLNKILQLSFAEHEGSADLYAVILRGQDNIQMVAMAISMWGPQAKFLKVSFCSEVMTKYPYVALLPKHYIDLEREIAADGVFVLAEFPFCLLYKDHGWKSHSQGNSHTQNWGVPMRWSRSKASAPSGKRNMRLQEPNPRPVCLALMCFDLQVCWLCSKTCAGRNVTALFGRTSESRLWRALH